MTLSQLLQQLKQRIGGEEISSLRPHYFESLESRVLLSASFDAGVLTIQGTSDHDFIQLNAGNNPGEVIVAAAPDVDPNTAFSDVTQIVIETLEGNDTIRLGDLAIDAEIDAGEGHNFILGGQGDDDITAGSGNDTVIDENGNNTIDAGDGHNRVITGEGDDDVTAGAGHDLFVDRGGTNTFDAGDGNNRVITGEGDDNVTAGEGHDLFVDRGGNNTFDAGDGNNRVITGDGDDNVAAGAGHDLIVDRGGTNSFDAGDGNNRVIVGDGDDSVASGAGNDLIVDRGGNNNFDAGDGNNHVIAGIGNDKIGAGIGDDFILDHGGNNAVNVRGGNNRVFTGNGDDEVNTGEGQDTIIDRGGRANRVRAGAGNDTVIVTDGDNTIELGDGDDFGVAGRGVDRIFGGKGKDNIRGRAGDHIEDEPDNLFAAHPGNNSKARATRIDLGADHEATLTGSLVWHNDHRFYLFTPEVSGELHVELEATSGPAPRVEVKTDLDDENADSDATTGDDDDELLLELGDSETSGTVEVNAGQTYIIKTWANGFPAEYAIDLALIQPSAADPETGEPANEVSEVEPNDTKASATLFALGSDGEVTLNGVADGQDDVDIFRFTPDQTGTLSIEVLENGATLVDVDVEDINGPAGLELSPADDGVKIGELEVTAGEDYFLRIETPDDVSTPFEIKIS